MVGSNNVTFTRHKAKTAEIDVLRFTDKDLDIVGTLEYGQFGVVRVFTSRSTMLYLTAQLRSMLSLVA